MPSNQEHQPRSFFLPWCRWGEGGWGGARTTAISVSSSSVAAVHFPGVGASSRREFDFFPLCRRERRCT